MPSYALKKLIDNSNASGAILTCPANHVYLIKQLSVKWTTAGSGETVTLDVNGREVARVQGSSSAGLIIAALGSPNTSIFDAAGQMIGSVENLVLEAGDVLSLTKAGGAGTTEVYASGIDYLTI